MHFNNDHLVVTEIPTWPSSRLPSTAAKRLIVTPSHLFQGRIQRPQHFSIPCKFFSASLISVLIWSMPSSTRSSCSRKASLGSLRGSHNTTSRKVGARQHHTCIESTLTWLTTSLQSSVWIKHMPESHLSHVLRIWVSQAVVHLVYCKNLYYCPKQGSILMFL